jgi:hypothetical protein
MKTFCAANWRDVAAMKVGNRVSRTTYRAGFYYLGRSIERAPPGRPGTTSMKKGEDGVRARRCKTGYILLILTAWGGSMISQAAPEDGDFIDIKKICLRPPLRFIIQ